MRLESKEQVSDVGDVRPIPVVSRSRRLNVPRVLLALAVLVGAAGLVLYAYQTLTKSARDEQRVNSAIQILRANQEMAGVLERMSKWPREMMLIGLSEHFPEHIPGVPGQQAARASLDLAIAEGSLQARVALGKALRDGHFGKKDNVAALKVFNETLAHLSAGIKTGDTEALYVYSLMLREGLGVELDVGKANEILRRVAPSRDRVTRSEAVNALLRTGTEPEDFEAIKELVRQLMREGEAQLYIVGVVACMKRFGLPEGERNRVMDLIRSGETPESREALRREAERRASLYACRSEFIQTAAAMGNEDAKSELGDLQMSSPNRAADRHDLTRDVQGRPPAKRSPGEQATGYLQGEPQSAPAGRSTFQVDNEDGEADATVRIYQNGQRRAVRSVYVRKGESFTIPNLAPGTYVMRYRFSGSDKTYKADDTFQLSETPTETGTTYSKVRVTLYRVPRGNLSVSEVPSDDF